MNAIWLAFLTGLTTGGLSCLAVQGGLLASSITAKDQGDTGYGGNRWVYVTAFLLAKLTAYVILGYMLGWLGSTLTLSPKLLGTVQIIVGLFMLATAARILDLHPWFRYLVITPPRWAYRLMRNKSRDSVALPAGRQVFGPAVLGFLTVFMPCGVTQATMAIAISSGSPMLGAAIMGAFVLGTSPIFFALGASFIELLNRRSFAYVAAGVVTVFAVLTINGGFGLRGSFFTIQNLYRAATTSPEELALGGSPVTRDDNGIQNVTINVASNGYQATSQTLKKDVPVRLTLVTNNTGGCARAFTVPDLNISKILPNTGREIIEFTPTKAGRLAYSCSMGMYTGSFNVIP